MIVCKKCLIEKEVEDFYLEKRNKSGVMGMCIKCYNVKLKEWRYTNCDKLRKKVEKTRKENYDNIKLNAKKYYVNNVDKVNERNKQWRKKNSDKTKEMSKEWRKKNLDKIKKYNQIPKVKISGNMRKRIGQYLKINKISKRNKTFEIVGISPQNLILHLENKFQDNMSWDNYGMYGWHIDHIVPLSSAKTEEELYKLCHYTNLQPLWAEENLSKSNKITELIN